MDVFTEGCPEPRDPDGTFSLEYVIQITNVPDKIRIQTMSHEFPEKQKTPDFRRGLVVHIKPNYTPLFQYHRPHVIRSP